MRKLKLTLLCSVLFLTILGCEPLPTSEVNYTNERNYRSAYLGKRGFSDISPSNLNGRNIALCIYQGNLTIAYKSNNSIVVYGYDNHNWSLLGSFSAGCEDVLAYMYSEISMVAIGDELFIGYLEKDVANIGFDRFVVKKYSNEKWEQVGNSITSINDFNPLIAAKLATSGNRLLVAYSHQTVDVTINKSSVKEFINGSWIEICNDDFSKNHSVSMDFICVNDTPVVAHSFSFSGIGIKTLKDYGWKDELGNLDLMGDDLSLLSHGEDLYLSYSEYVPNDEFDRLKSYGQIAGEWKPLHISSSTGHIRRTLLFSYNNNIYLAYIHNYENESAISIALLEGKNFNVVYESDLPLEQWIYNNTLFFNGNALNVGFYDVYNANKLSVIQIDGF